MASSCLGIVSPDVPASGLTQLRLALYTITPGGVRIEIRLGAAVPGITSRAYAAAPALSEVTASRRVSGARTIGRVFDTPPRLRIYCALTSGAKSPYRIRAWKYLSTAASPLGTEIASASRRPS